MIEDEVPLMSFVNDSFNVPILKEKDH